MANLSEDLQRYNTLKHQSECPSPPPLERPLPPSSIDGNNTVQPTNQGPIDIDLDLPIAVNDGPFIEGYEGAAKEYGAGVTFMSEFVRDQHAGRVENCTTRSHRRMNGN